MLTKEIDLFLFEIEQQKIFLPNKEHLITKDLYKVINLGLFLQPWNSHKAKLISDEMLSVLSLVANNMEFDEVIISKEEIEELIGFVVELKKNIDSSLLSKQTKSYIYDLIVKIELSIKSYQINGSVVFKDIFTNTAGGIFIYKDDFSKASPEFLNPFKKLINKLIELNKQYEEISTLIENGVNLLSYLKK